MPQFLFADEAGCFTFEKKQNVSKYFILCTVTMTSLDVGIALQELRRKLIWEKAEVGDYFHATEDRQIIRDAVFTEILKHKFKVQASILEKTKAQPQVRVSKSRFYKYPWYYHFKHGIGPYVDEKERLFITAASIGNKKEKLTFCNAISDVVSQTVPKAEWVVDFRPCATDCCLQVADYCAWAIQRRWEVGDDRSYKLIEDRITYEYDIWKHGTIHYY